MKHDVHTTLRLSPNVPGCQNSDMPSTERSRTLPDVLRAESDTFHRAADVSPCLDQVSDASFVAL